jgi:hypothetical protein
MHAASWYHLHKWMLKINGVRSVCPASACPASARVPSIVEEWKYASAGRSSQGEMERRMVAQTAQKTYCIDTAEGQRRNRRSLHFGRDDKV